MAKPSFVSNCSAETARIPLERFWEQTGISDAGVTARFFQLFAGRAGGASESAQP